MSNEILRTFLLGEQGDASAPIDYMKGGDKSYHPIFKTMTYVRHFPILYRIHALVPSWFYTRCLPLAKYQRDAEDHIRFLIKQSDMLTADGKSKKKGLVYHFVEQDDSYRQRNMAAAVEEFTALQWGGREVLGHGLTNISFHLMNNPYWMNMLQRELQAVDFDTSTASYARLQELPYLKAICKEGIRMQLGGGFRIPRVNKDPVQYREWLIPANVYYTLT